MQGGSYLRIVRLRPLTLFGGDIGGSALKGLEYLTIRASREVHETLDIQSAKCSDSPSA